MGYDNQSAKAKLLPDFGEVFRPRELFLHDGANMKRLHFSTRAQIACAGLVATTAVGAVLSVGQIAVTAAVATSAAGEFAERQSERLEQDSKLAALEKQLEDVKTAAKSEVERLEARHAFLASVLSGEGDPAKLAASIPARTVAETKAAQDVISFFVGLEKTQNEAALAVQKRTDDRFAQVSGITNRLGVSASRVSYNGMGGPYEPVPAGALVTSQPTMAPKADAQFRALFNSWKRLDQAESTLVAIPSEKPVQNIGINSGFGVRSDPFRGGRAMHAGVDMPGPLGTPIYATADAVVGRTGWVGGYGNLIELEHGKGIQTRYGHLSSILVTPGAKIKRGQMIGLMGSTGRSTGSHLHYEVRIDGSAVNPIPFLQSSDYLLTLQARANATAMGGPEEQKTAGATK